MTDVSISDAKMMPAVTKTLQNDALDMIKGTSQGDLTVEVANLTPGRPHGEPPGCPS